MSTDHIKALSKVQKDLKHAKKDDKGAFGKYADLASVYEVIRKPLVDNGFSYIHSLTTQEDGTHFVDTLLMHETGGTFKTSLPLIINKRDMQGLGSAITYAKRYGISMIVGLASEEDDEGKGAGTAKGNVNTSTEAQQISNILVYNSKGEVQKCKTLNGAVKTLNIIMKNQFKKYSVEELPEVGKQMRERNKEVLEQIRNHKDFINEDTGKNYTLFNIEEKLFKMENGDAPARLEDGNAK